MAKKRYKFNPQTLTYEVITIPFRIKFYRALRKVLIGFILASIVNVLFSFFFYTPKMYRISRDNNELLIKYNMLNDKLRAATARLQEIRHRDNSVYRSLFGTDSLNMQGIYTPYPDSKYKHLNNDLYTPLMVSTWKELDGMSRLLYLESKSLDELEERLKTFRKSVFLVGDGAELCYNTFGSRVPGITLAPEFCRYQTARGVAAEASERAADAVTADRLQPVYLRLPQAERELRQRQEQRRSEGDPLKN